MARQPWPTVDGTGDPAELSLEIRGHPDQLPLLRRVLFTWLQAIGANEDDVVAIQIAAAEAAANAVEHAYLGAEPGLVRLTAQVEPGNVVRVEICDTGRWRPQRTFDNARGRGLLLMRECSDEVNLMRSDQGTTVVLRLRLGMVRD